jgi:hypothetical protein
MEARMPKMNRYLVFSLLFLSTAAMEAHAAITERLKDACRNEYYAYCSQYEVGSDGLRSCMRAAQDQLSQGCLKEMVAAGEASQAEIKAYNSRKHR